MPVPAEFARVKCDTDHHDDHVATRATTTAVPRPAAHVHHGFDETIHVLDGEPQVVTGRSDPRPAPAGSPVLAARGTRLWSPGSALVFMEDVGGALPSTGAPDPARSAEVYRRHDSEVSP